MSRSSLPLEREGPSSWKRVFIIGTAGVAATLVLNGAAEDHLGRAGPNWSHRLVEAKFDLVDTASRSADWVILGDSSAAHAVRPDVWMAAVPAEVWNLATVAGLGVTGDVWMLDRYLAHSDAPAAVVLMHTVDMWDRAVDPGLAGQVPGSVMRLVRTRPWPDWSVGAWGQFGLSRYVPLMAESRSLVSSLFGRPLPNGLRFSMDDRGWVRSRTPDAAQLQRDAQAFATTLASPAPPMSADNRQALEALGDRCRSRGIALHVVHAPVWQGVEAGMDVHVRSIERQIAQLVEPLDVHFVSRSPGVAAADLESTVDHLRPEAATDFTLRLVRALEAVTVAPSGVPPAAGATPDGSIRPR